MECRADDRTVFECLLLTMSEVGIPKRLFEEYLPILGPAHGLGCLGVFQALYVPYSLNAFYDNDGMRCMEYEADRVG